MAVEILEIIFYVVRIALWLAVLVTLFVCTGVIEKNHRRTENRLTNLELEKEAIKKENNDLTQRLSMITQLFYDEYTANKRSKEE